MEWPGLCRSGKGAPGALTALSDYVGRYGTVATMAGHPLPFDQAVAWEVVEEVPTRSGGADFGVPTTQLDRDAQPFDGPEQVRAAAILPACWAYLDQVVAGSPPELRKGPRGGGRDRDAIAEHVAAAEQMFASRVGLKLSVPGPGEAAVVGANRAAVLAWCMGDGAPAPASRAPRRARTSQPWSPRYAVRRLAWHVLDHAWEIEDRRS